MSTSDQPNPTESAADPGPRPVFALPEVLRGRLEGVARQVHDELAVVEGRDLRALLQHEVAEAEERLRGDEPAAARAYLAAFNARPGFRPPLDALIRLYTRRRSVQNLTRLFDAMAKAAPTPHDKAEALTRKAELQEDRLDDLPGARATFEAAVAVEPGYLPAWLGLERLALRSGDRELLVRCLAQLADRTQDPNRKARLLLELATELARSEDPALVADAAQWLRVAAEQPMGRWRALTELERFGERTGRIEDVVYALEGKALLAQQVAAGESFQGGSGAFSLNQLAASDQAATDAAALWSRAARLRLLGLHDAAGAWAAMDQALAQRPDDARLRFVAVSLADQAGDPGRAGEHATWLLAQGFGDAPLRASLHFRVAELAALQGDAASAARSLRAALALDPQSAAARAALLEQLVAAGDGLEVVHAFDQLAEAAESPEARASLLRVAAVYALALRGAVDEAARRFRVASELDPADVVSRRALVTLLGRMAFDGTPRSEEEVAALVQARRAAVDGLLGHVHEPAERGALLLERYDLERYGARDLEASAKTAEQLVEVTDEDAWAMERAALCWAAAGHPGHAARWAEHLSLRDDLPGGAAEARAWSSASARWFCAAGEEGRAREIALVAHLGDPADLYLSALSLRLSLDGGDVDLAVQVVSRTAEALDDRGLAVRWLLTVASLLEARGATDPMRRVLAQAVALQPEDAAVRAAVLAATRWRGDAATRAQVAEAALTADAVDDEALALVVELALVRGFVEHDVGAAARVLAGALAREGSEHPAVALFGALASGAVEGPDAAETVDALQALLQAIPSDDPLRVGVELEVARALGASASTRDQAAAARELVDEDRPELAAPRLLALLDAIQRDDREAVPGVLGRVADLGDAASTGALRAAAMAGLRAQGRAADALRVAGAAGDSAAAVVLRSEATPSLERALDLAGAAAARAPLAQGEARASLRRVSANWASLGGDHAAALEGALGLAVSDPDDLAAWDVVRVAGRRLGRFDVVCDACEAMAARVKSTARAGALWEEAGVVALDALGRADRAERSLRRALDADPRRVVSYRKLREVLEARRDVAGLEALVSRRAAVVEEVAEQVELAWEQARLRRALGLRDGALEAAQKVVLRDPDHVAARALVAEIHATSGRLAEAAEALAALAACRETPRAQRRAARLGAVELYQRRLEQPVAAIAQLDALVREGDADDAALARGLEIAQGAGLWEAAQRFSIRQVERLPESPARVALLLRLAELERDRLRDAEAARAHAQAAHGLAPGDLAVLRVLQGLSFPDDRARNARRTLEALRERMRGEGPSADLLQGFAEVARSGGDGVLERAALRALRMLDGATEGPALGSPQGTSLRDPQLLLRYRHPQDSGRAVALLERALPELSELAMMTTDALRLGRSERVRGANPTRSAVAPLLAAVGVTEFELYVGGADPQRALVLPGDPVSVVLGRAVAVPLDEATRFSLVRSALLSLRGCAPMVTQELDAVTNLALAAMAYAELPLAAGHGRYEALVKPVGKPTSRKTRRAVAESARALAQSPELLEELGQATRAIRATARRGALAVSGAVTAAFEDLGRVLGPGVDARAALRSDAGRELMLFCVSDALAQVARETGVDRR